MQQPTNIRAVGRWRSILPQLGVHESHLTGRHTPCPICGGNDRFRFDDKGGYGSFICSHCGAGDGITLVKLTRGIGFVEACKLVEEVLPTTVAVIPKAVARQPFNSMGGWHKAVPLNGEDPASLYLAGRGLKFDRYPAMLRYWAEAPYKHEDARVTHHPALVSRFISPDAETSTVHTTYLTNTGEKATLPLVRKFAPGKIPDGGAVRLSSSAEVMGIAEGIETALSAAQLHGVPVWAALSANNLLKWQPPKSVRCVRIFGDHDASFAGQHVAFGLAYRLKGLGYQVKVELPSGIGDWNDALQGGWDHGGSGYSGL